MSNTALDLSQIETSSSFDNQLANIVNQQFSSPLKLDIRDETILENEDKKDTSKIEYYQHKIIRFDILHNVYGIIISCDKYEVHARTYEHDGEYIEDITFSIDEFPHQDRHLVKNKAAFYWKVGKKTLSDGSIRNASEFKMRRLFRPVLGIDELLSKQKFSEYKKVFDL
jgi:hypothetical protein